MSSKTYPAIYTEDLFAVGDRIARHRLPVIAAVAGFALGGGCELAMMCDIVLAADTAKFGQPEIKLGVIPGIGGTQRLARAVGKAKAMELCLTGRMMGAEEAERAGLVARIVPAADLLDDAMKTAATIASMSRPVAMMTKEAVDRADETNLAEGVRFERRVFHALFALADQKEGMKAFVEKRPAAFSPWLSPMASLLRPTRTSRRPRDASRASRTGRPSSPRARRTRRRAPSCSSNARTCSAPAPSSSAAP